MEFFLPRSLDQLWRVLEDNPGARVYTGGTDLLVELERGGPRPPALVCLERIGRLKIVRDWGDGVFIGAAATHGQLLADRLVGRHFPVLKKALAELGSPQIRNMGTIGGNVVTASPAGDCLPPLYVLEAEVELRSAGGTRRLKVADFIRGPGKTCLVRGEILAGIFIPKQPAFNVQHFEKVGRRKALAIAVVSLAACLALSETGRVKKARLAWGSVGPTVVTVEEAEKRLENRCLDAQSLSEAARIARCHVSPIDDVRASAAYRRQVAGNLLMRLGLYGPKAETGPGAGKSVP